MLFKVSLISVIGIMYNIWGFLFSNFSLADAKDSSGIWGWELIHFPLHFAILLLISGLIVSSESQQG